MSYILASTLGFDQADMAGYRYQSTRTKRSIYAIGNQYFCVSQRRPKDEDGFKWSFYEDQFFAKRKKTSVWVSGSEG